MNAISKLLDLPPVWLIAALAVTYALRVAAPQMHVEVIGAQIIGGGLILLGIGVLLAAVWQFLRHRTTIIPRGTPRAFLRRGVYRLSRNPIYLADALILFGAIIWWGVPLALPLVPLFILLISKRFIRSEEAALRAAFGTEFENWAKETRRWI